MFERILVPLDGSALAEGVLPFAKAVAERFDGELVLMRAVPSFTEIVARTVPREALPIAPVEAELGVDVATEEYESLKAQAERYLQGLSERLQAEGRKVRTEVREGQPAGTILEAADAIDAGLISMSTHGHGGLKRLINGSVADEVMRRSRVPLLVIRPAGQPS